MRRLLILLLLAFAALAAAHPSPTSAVVLRMHASAIDAELSLPVVELKLGWDLPPSQPFPLNDARFVVERYGEALKGYIRGHIHPVAPDGRAWTVVVNRVTPVDRGR